MNLLAAELRLVANSIERALARCLDHRLAIDTRRLLDELKRHRGGTPPSLGPPALAEMVAQWNPASTDLRRLVALRFLRTHLPFAVNLERPRTDPTGWLVAGAALLALLAAWALIQSGAGGSSSGDLQQRRHH